jgi:hypothetical protein
LNLRLSPTTEPNAKMAREWTLCSTNSVPNREGKRGRNFASKEREEAKIQLLSPQRQISEATTESRKRPDSRAGWPRADAVVLAWPAGGGVAPLGSRGAGVLDGSSPAGGGVPRKAGSFAGGAAGARDEQRAHRSRGKGITRGAAGRQDRFAGVVPRTPRSQAHGVTAARAPAEADAGDPAR